MLETTFQNRLCKKNFFAFSYPNSIPKYFLHFFSFKKMAYDTVIIWGGRKYEVLSFYPFSYMRNFYFFFHSFIRLLRFFFPDTTISIFIFFFYPFSYIRNFWPFFRCIIRLFSFYSTSGRLTSVFTTSDSTLGSFSDWQVLPVLLS